MISGFLSHLNPEKNSEVFDASCGPIRGNIYKHGEKIVNGYLGIPFAQPPVSELRYQKPVPLDKWTEPRDCYSYGPGCPQTGLFARFVPDQVPVSEEDGLSLNVFAPTANDQEFSNGLPVMVYFHGGGYEVGMSSTIHDYCLSGTLPLKDVIVVTANYRLGPLGFLTTGDEVAKGNYGLWDQTLALKWVQDHIKSFGGDPQNVTIRTSAGGSSVDLLSLSPHSNKLFKRVISMSGAGYCNFAIRPKKDQAKVFEEFARHHGYSGNSSEDVLQWYQSQHYSKFKEMSGFSKSVSGFLNFIPNFEDDFFPKPLDTLRKEAPKIDFLATVGEYEGLSIGFQNPLFADSFKNFGAIIAGEFGEDIIEDSKEVQEKILSFYKNNGDWTDKAVVDKELVKFYGDAVFNSGVLDSVKSYAKNRNNAYLASFDYFNKEKSDPFANLLPFSASSHGSEFKYIFGVGMMSEFSPTEEELRVIEMMGNFIANFVKYGNPNQKTGVEQWEKYDLSQPGKYFKIDYPRQEMKDKFQEGRLHIYDEINNSSKRYQEIIIGND